MVVSSLAVTECEVIQRGPDEWRTLQGLSGPRLGPWKLPDWYHTSQMSLHRPAAHGT